MRKAGMICLMLTLVCGLAAADRATLDETKTQIAQPMPEPPVIDGVMNADEWFWATGANPGGGDSYWAIQYDEQAEDFVRGGNNPVTTTGGPLYPEDINIQIYVGFDDENLYVGVRVDDDIIWDDTAAAGSENGNTWQDESVDVFIDGDNSNNPTRDTTGTNPAVVDTGGQYVITVNNAYRQAEAGNPGYGENAAWYAQASIITDTHYEAEFRISLDTIGNPQPGDIIGFDIAVNDDDEGGAVTNNQYTWSGATHEEITYGNLILGQRSYTAPKVPSPTLDGAAGAGEYGDAELVNINKYNGVYDILSGDDDWPLEDHSFSFQAAHDDEAVYVFCDAVDDIISTDSAAPGEEGASTWEDDSCEILFDADDSNDSGAGALGFEGQYVLTPNGAYRDIEANDPVYETDWFGAASQSGGGYQVEFKILKANLSDPPDGATMGFSICINDDDGNNRKAQLCWNGRPHNELTYGFLTLAAGSTSVEEWSLY